MKPTAFVTHPDCSRHDTGWRHPEHQGRLPAVARAVYRDMLTLFDHLLEVEGRPATNAELELVHDARYLEGVRRRVAEAQAEGRVLELDGDAVVSGASWEALQAASGCVLNAVEVVEKGLARNAFCSVRPPGAGAGADHAGGFALVNHVAVATCALRARGRRVLVVHWGDAPAAGTAEIVALDPGVRLLSLFRARPGLAPLPPPTRSAALPADTDGPAFAEALDAALHGALDGFAPDFLLLGAGFDLLSSDPLGGLAVRPADVHPATLLLRQCADAVCGGRLVSALEGGYDSRATGDAVVQHLRALADLPAA